MRTEHLDRPRVDSNGTKTIARQFRRPRPVASARAPRYPAPRPALGSWPSCARGYREGENLVIVPRYTAGGFRRRDVAAAELVRRRQPHGSPAEAGSGPGPAAARRRAGTASPTRRRSAPGQLLERRRRPELDALVQSARREGILAPRGGLVAAPRLDQERIHHGHRLVHHRLELSAGIEGGVEELLLLGGHRLRQRA